MYLYTIDSPSASLIEKNGVLYKIVHDPGLGSVRYIVNIDTKENVQEIEYDELGNMIYNSNKDFQVLGYAGGLFDSDTGLTRFGARDYDPTVGRWTTKDPIGFNGGDTNLYAYVAGNPISYVDPSGTTCHLSQSSGLTICSNIDGEIYLIEQGYSGNGVGKNNTNMQNATNIGPLPQGVYTIRN